MRAGLSEGLGIGQAIHRGQQTVWTAWLRRRRRADFERVERFCLFIGYPRSGHSIMGACLNAHPDAVVSHELNVAPLILAGCTRIELYARILARAGWFNLRGNTSNYRYQVPGQWQGRFRSLRVIGDKRGGAMTRALAEHPDLLERVRALVGVPLRLIHVVRNPFDNIAAISIWHDLSLSDSADYYFQHCRTTARLGEICSQDELTMVRHEDVIAAPTEQLTALCRFLGLDPDPGYLAGCGAVILPAPTRTRSRVAWSDELIRDVEERMRAVPFLQGYGFDPEL